MAPLRISSSRRWRFFIFLINNSEIAKPHVALSQAFRIYQVWKNSCLTHTATLGIMKDLTQRPRTLVRQSCRRAHSACLPGTGSEQLSLDPPCARVRNALGCAACLSVRHGHTSLACWTHDEAVRKKWKKKKSTLCKVLLLPVALGQRSYSFIPRCESLASPLFAIPHSKH